MGLFDVLAAAGIDVVDERVDPRPGAYHPVGIMWHHTGGAPTGDLPTLETLKDGRADLEGPLCQDGIGREGTVAAISDGRANASGRGSSATLFRVKADVAPTGVPGPDDTDCNEWYINLEIENTGSQGYPDVQLAAVVAVSAAYCREYGWTANRCVGHKESTHRKNDASFDCFAMRARVATALSAPVPKEDEMPAKPFIYRVTNDPENTTAVDGTIWCSPDAVHTFAMDYPSFVHHANQGLLATKEDAPHWAREYYGQGVEVAIGRTPQAEHDWMLAQTPK